MAADRQIVGKSVTIRELTKVYGDVAAIRNISMTIEPGEFVSLLGPSGSGKTTTMMAVAGFVDDCQGSIFIGERRVDRLPPQHREIGVVFQHLALFPHMSVADNLSFPLRLRGVGKKDVAQRVHAALDLVRLTGFETRLPGQLSGGQQQRVALARAIIFDPPVLLLDEPLGALDRKLRESMQQELRSLHRQLGVTFVLVTHDQEEAMTISDRVAVMNQGEIMQFGPPREIYERPASTFVADFLGNAVMLEGVGTPEPDGLCRVALAEGLTCLARAAGPLRPNQTVTLMLRPEKLILGGEGEAMQNRFTGIVQDVTFTGDRIKYLIDLKPDLRVAAVVQNRREARQWSVGQTVPVCWQAEDTLAFPTNS